MSLHQSPLLPSSQYFWHLCPLNGKIEVNQIYDFGCGDGFYLKYFGSLSPKELFRHRYPHSMIERQNKMRLCCRFKKGLIFKMILI